MLQTGRCSVEKAAIRALGRFLESCFAEDPYWAGKGVVVSDHWPDSNNLPEYSISILKAGARQDERQQALLVSSEVLDATTGLYTYRVAACEQPIQLDVWSTSEVGRESIEASLDDYLHRGERFTLGIETAQATRDGLLVALDPADGHTGFADCSFSGPSDADTGEAHSRSEFRSMYRGDISVELCVQARERRHLRTVLSLALGENEPPRPTFDLTLTP